MNKGEKRNYEAMPVSDEDAAYVRSLVIHDDIAVLAFPPTLAGTYSAMIEEDAVLTEELGGLITMTVTGTGGEVGREVAGIDVGDRGDESGPQDRGAAPEAALGQDVLEFAGRTADRRRVGQYVFYRDLVLLAGHQLDGCGLMFR